MAVGVLVRVVVVVILVFGRLLLQFSRCSLFLVVLSCCWVLLVVVDSCFAFGCSPF